jgi:peptide/nickel transport system substrate-binding protein
MARRIRWQLLIAALSTVIVLLLVSYLALTTAAVSRPIQGGDVVEALLYAPRHVNPLLSNPADDQGAADIQALVFDGLLRADGHGRLQAGLAELPTVDETGQVYTFSLRPGVTWQDGTPFTMRDVLFTIHAIQNPAYSGNPNLNAIWQTVTVEQIDETQFRCRLRSPYAGFLEAATFPVLPAHVLEQLPPESWATAPFNTAPIGTGPYRLTELTAEHALLRANPSYYRGRPFINSIELRFMDNTQAALAALVKNDVQALSYVSSNALRSEELPRTLVRYAAPLDGYTILTFNLRSGPLADTGLRRALATGLDRDQLINQVFDGLAGPIDSPLLPQWWAASADVSWYGYDQARAAALLDDLGYPAGADGRRARDGVPLTFTLLTDSAPDRVATAQEIARQWGQLGIAVDVQQLEMPVLEQRLAAHDFTLAIHAWQRVGPDPDLYELWSSDQADQGRNYAGLKDDALDQLILRLRAEQKADTRQGLYGAFQQRWIELAPSIPLYQPLLFYATARELGGIDMGLPPDAATYEQVLFGRESRYRSITGWFLRSAREIEGDLRQP